MSGYFITLEGIDGSGKTVQAELLLDKLQSVSLPTVYFRDPGTNPISERIREVLLDKVHVRMSAWTELLLYEAARAQMVEENISPALSEGKVVVCDRFYDSTTCYQGYGRQLDLETVTLANRIGACGLVPDLTLVLDVSIRTARGRRRVKNLADDRLESEAHAFHERVREGYFAIARLEPERIIIVKGDTTIEAVSRQVWDIVLKRCPLMGNEEK